MMFQKTAVVLCLAALGSAAAVQGQERMPDFGPDGLAGLSAKQRTELARGGIVLPEGAVKTTRGSSLVEAAFIIDRPPGEVWCLLSKTEFQTHYVPEVKSARIVWEAGEESCLELTVRVIGRSDLESVRKYVDSGGTWRNPKSHD
jgi:hypothetical protein